MNPRATPFVSWRWKVEHLLEGADITDTYASDSPVRIALGFDGDKSTLPFLDQMMFERARLLSGNELPYATLVYVWENRLPVESIQPNTRTNRIQKLVVASGPRDLFRWQTVTRDFVADYTRAFGHAPGRLITVGVMSDTDNTRTRVRAYYGDIIFSSTQQPK